MDNRISTINAEGCARRYAQNPPQKLASTGDGRYGDLLVWEISLVRRSGKNQSKFGSLHQVDSEANDHKRYYTAIWR